MHITHYSNKKCKQRVSEGNTSLILFQEVIRDFNIYFYIELSFRKVLFFQTMLQIWSSVLSFWCNLSVKLPVTIFFFLFFFLFKSPFLLLIFVNITQTIQFSNWDIQRWKKYCVLDKKLSLNHQCSKTSCTPPPPQIIPLWFNPF